MNLIKESIARLRRARFWVTAQFIGLPLLLLIGIAWTRLPEKYLWQVALTFLLPLFLVASFLALQAATLRSLTVNDGKRARLAVGALSLLAWLATACFGWALLNWFNDQIGTWAAYLNSIAPASWRAKAFTFQHIKSCLDVLEWILCWIVLPAKLIPCALASSQVGFRLCWHKLFQFLWNWRWWLAVTLAALVGIWLPSHFFQGLPHGTVTAQIWRVSLKLIATYLLALTAWLMLLSWATMLYERQQLRESGLDVELFRRIRVGRMWVWMQFGLAFLSTLADVVLACLPKSLSSSAWVVLPIAVVFLISAVILQTATIRSFMEDGQKQIRLVWGALSVLFWSLLALSIAIALTFLGHAQVWSALGWIVLPAIFLPIAAVSGLCGMRLPWKRVFRVLGQWRWWLAVLFAVLMGIALPKLFAIESLSVANPAHFWTVASEQLLSIEFTFCCWVLLLAWLAVLFNRQQGQQSEQEKDDSVKLPLAKNE